MTDSIAQPVQAPSKANTASHLDSKAEPYRQIVTVEHHLGRDRSTGQFIATCPPAHATVAIRPHLLTMMNRLFDSPPPMPALGTKHSVHASGLTPPTWPANSTTCAYRCPRFDRAHWPHFSNDFIRYEHMVLAAHDQLFEIHGREFARARRHRLLLDGLLAPTNSIPRDTAAAVGWAVSWLGPSQALTPPTGFVAPALGLTGWLTNLPLRTPHISGHYLLYGEAVHPVSLAIRRGAAAD